MSLWVILLSDALKMITPTAHGKVYPPCWMMLLSTVMWLVISDTFGRITVSPILTPQAPMSKILLCLIEQFVQALRNQMPLTPVWAISHDSKFTLRAKFASTAAGTDAAACSGPFPKVGVLYETAYKARFLKCRFCTLWVSSPWMVISFSSIGAIHTVFSTRSPG